MVFIRVFLKGTYKGIRIYKGVYGGWMHVSKPISSDESEWCLMRACCVPATKANRRMVVPRPIPKRAANVLVIIILNPMMNLTGNQFNVAPVPLGGIINKVSVLVTK